MVKCPYCGKESESFLGFGEKGVALPEEGNPHVCIECGKVSVFNADMALRTTSNTELDEFLSDSVFVSVVEFVRQMINEKSETPVEE